MEAAAGVAAVRGVSLPVPSSQPSRKEWRAVSEHSVQNAGNEGNPIRNNMLNDSMDLGTPSAPPIMDIGGEGIEIQGGNIISVVEEGDWQENIRSGQVIDYGKAVVMPGLIDV
ncbi:hypothetical protein F0562_014217 [Nyssa sinensis]|uniref:Allantoinase composite domain-containing protein n=1 Tax=Nyssa sinensis TaxID=561372 RepID=A0A5J4ZSC0_9ASTE|nr:hypothetical protein F0562_014217 [Nyssa sinensis]